MMKLKNPLKLFLFIVMVAPSTSYAYELSDVSLFGRCFNHLTRKAPKLNNPLLLQVIAGTKTGPEACLEVLNSAKLTANGKIAQPNNQVAKDVLNTFFAVHSDWFLDKTYQGVTVNDRFTQEPSVGSNYYSRALFDPKFKFEDIFSGTNSVSAMRTTVAPAMSIQNRTPAQYIVGRLDLRVAGETPAENIYFDTGYTWTGFQLPDRDDLVGFKEETLVQAPGSIGRPTVPQYVNGSRGGGIVGNRQYIRRTVNTSIRNNGGLVVPRRYGRALFYDFLCQDLPVINPNNITGASGYVNPTSPIPFRTNKACAGCHISMDQVSNIIRHNVTQSVGIARDNAQHTTINFEDELTRLNVTPITENYTWPTSNDPNYYRKPAHGRFVYNTTDGQFIDRAINGFDALGNILKGLDDVYLCAANRYFKHFTGIEIPITQMSKEVKDKNKHAIFIKKLGSNFKSSQDPMKLVEEIITSEFYRDSNYGTLGAK